MDPSAGMFAVLPELAPVIPWIVGFGVLGIVVGAPIPGRGPGFPRRRDPWRGFKFETRRTVMRRAGDRCEGSMFLAWGRCRRVAVEVDHIYPWSKGGATIISNGQALCREHNRSKSSLTPPWWYVLSLERRRRAYFPEADDLRVHAGMNPAERDARADWAAKRRAR